MPGLMTEAVIEDGLLPSYDDMDFLPQEDDLYTQVFGHHDLHQDTITEEEWETGF